jgi:hypothetical protein
MPFADDLQHVVWPDLCRVFQLSDGGDDVIEVRAVVVLTRGRGRDTGALIGF